MKLVWSLESRVASGAARSVMTTRTGEEITRSYVQDSQMPGSIPGPISLEVNAMVVSAVGFARGKHWSYCDGRDSESYPGRSKKKRQACCFLPALQAEGVCNESRQTRSAQ